MILNNEKLRIKADEIWKSAIKLRGKFKAYEYQNVILPVIMLRRIECVLKDKRQMTRQMVIQGYPEYGALESDTKEVKEEKNLSIEKIVKDIEMDCY